MKHFLWIFMLAFNASAQAVLSGNGALIGNASLASIATSGGGGGSPAFVEFVAGPTNDSSSSHVLSITVAAGNTIVYAVKWEDADKTPTVTSSLDGALTALTKTNSGGVVYGQMFYKINCTAGTHTISNYLGSTTAYIKGGAWELSGVTAVDNEEPVAGIGNSGATVRTAGTITLDASPEVFCIASANYTGFTAAPKSGWTEDYDTTAFHAQHLVTSGTGTEYGEATIGSGLNTEIIFGQSFK